MDQRLATTVTLGTNAATVSSVQLQNCVNGALGVAVWSAAGGWPVGLENGIGGAAVINVSAAGGLEWPWPVAAGRDFPAGPARDALFTTTGGRGGQAPTIDLGGTRGGANPAAIPVLNRLRWCCWRRCWAGVALRAAVFGRGEAAGAGGGRGGRGLGLGRARRANHQLQMALPPWLPMIKGMPTVQWI